MTSISAECIIFLKRAFSGFFWKKCNKLLLYRNKVLHLHRIQENETQIKGKLPEWSNGADSKSAVRLVRTGGLNPSLSASKRSWYFNRLRFFSLSGFPACLCKFLELSLTQHGGKRNYAQVFQTGLPHCCHVAHLCHTSTPKRTKKGSVDF